MGQAKMPAIYISKYNRFIDNVIGRINRVLGKSYDPVRVKMPDNAQKSNTTKKNKGKGKGQKKKNNRRNNKNRTRTEPVEVKNKMGELPLARTANDVMPNQERLIGMYSLNKIITKT